MNFHGRFMHFQPPIKHYEVILSSVQVETNKILRSICVFYPHPTPPPARGRESNPFADEHNLKTAYMVDKMADNPSASHWVLLTSSQEFLDLPAIKAATLAIQPRPDWQLWTDNFNNLLQVFKAGE